MGNLTESEIAVLSYVHYVKGQYCFSANETVPSMRSWKLISMQELYNDFLLCCNNLTSGDVVNLDEYGFLYGAKSHDAIGNGLLCLNAFERLRTYQGKNRMKLVGNYLDVF
jgi:hypothetical protein